ncbi:D-2-hydroxyacid dehydrogenase [Candidatus Chlorohelix sp.]|uniref:D-2-hydroxyacid dehydrogenase n=1 Tax=Candidatus Chlorohelix sp. TaxID=3139201 RepID=UPI003064F190
MPGKLLCLNGLPPEFRDKISAIATDGGMQITFIPETLKGDERDILILNEIRKAEVIFGGFLKEEQFLVARMLRWIHAPFAGVNRILEIPQLVESEVILTNAAGIMAGALADQVMGYIILHARHLLEQRDYQKQHKWVSNWNQNQPAALAGKTLGIIGYGKIGREIAKRARAFDMRVIATKRILDAPYPELDRLYPDTELKKLLAESDYIVVAAPLTPQTKGLIGYAEFELMKRTAYFINIARGALVKEAEMVEALKDALISGAALDVFETEPLPNDSPIWELPNVFITPHSSGNFDGFLPATAEFFCQNLHRWLNGETLLNIVNKRLGY